MTIEEQITAYKLLRENGQAFFVNAYEDADRIISALEKQIPKKPNRIEYVDGGAEDDCPNCGKRICMVFGNGDTFRWQMPYCCDCGQALKWDWSEGEEE